MTEANNAKRNSWKYSSVECRDLFRGSGHAI